MYYSLFDWNLYSVPEPEEWVVDGDNYVAKIMIPGASKEDVELTVKDKVLKLSFKGNEFVIKFEKEWRLANGMKARTIEGHVQDGVLTIKVKRPKIETETIKVE